VIWLDEMTGTVAQVSMAWLYLQAGIFLSQSIIRQRYRFILFYWLQIQQKSVST